MIKWRYLVQLFLLSILVGSVGGQKVKVQAAPVPVTIDGFDILDPAKWSVDTQNNYVCQTGMSGAGSDGTLGAWGVVEAKNGKLYLYRDVNCAHRFVYVSSQEDYELDTPFFEAEVTTALEDPTGWGVGWGVENLFGLWYVNYYSPPRFEWWGPDGTKRQVDLPLNLQEGFHTYKVSNLQLPGDSLHASFQVLVDGEIKYQETYTVTLDMLGRSGKIWFGNPVLGQCDGWHSCHWANGTLDETGAGPWPRLAVDYVKVDGYPPIPLPSLNVYPPVLTFPPITKGTSSAEQRSIFVYNDSGGGTLNWSTSENSNWFRTSPSSGSSTNFIDGDTIWVTLENTSGLAVGTHTQTIIVSGQIGAQNSPQTVSVGLVVNPPPTGRILGYVWNDLDGDGVKEIDEGEFNKAGVPVQWLGPGGVSGSMRTNSREPDNFAIPNLAVGLYTVSVALEPGWAVTAASCPGPPTSSCANINVTNGGTAVVWFGIWNNPSGWFQARNGDVYAASVSVPIPSNHDPSYERWFIDAVPDSSGGGVALSSGSIDCSGRTSQRGWEVSNYSSISWPGALDSITQDAGVIDYETDFSINSNAEAAALAGKILVAGNNITVGGDVTQISAILVAKNQIVINGSGNNNVLTIKGAMFAKDGFDLPKTLNNNRKPAIVVEYDPSYLLQTIPGLTKARVSWREVKSP